MVAASKTTLLTGPGIANVLSLAGAVTVPAELSSIEMIAILRSASATYSLGVSIPTTSARPVAGASVAISSAFVPVLPAMNVTPALPAAATWGRGRTAKPVSLPLEMAEPRASLAVGAMAPRTAVGVSPPWLAIARSRFSSVAASRPVIPARVLASAVGSVMAEGNGS